jgi:hypothetical protein
MEKGYYQPVGSIKRNRSFCCSITPQRPATAGTTKSPALDKADQSKLYVASKGERVNMIKVG